MATRFKFRQSILERRRRSFSIDFKAQKVRELEQKITTITELRKEYEVSDTTIYRWLRQFSITYMKGVKTIVEAESDTRKIAELKAQIAELEMVVGQKQIQLEFKDKMIELAEDVYKVDIKKKFGVKPSSGTGKGGKNSPAV